MPIAGNPKKLALDVAQGYQQFSPSSLRQYNPEDLKIIIFNLNLVVRELRAKQIPLEDIDALKDKNNKIRRLTQAVNVIQAFSSSRGVKI